MGWDGWHNYLKVGVVACPRLFLAVLFRKEEKVAKHGEYPLKVKQEMEERIECVVLTLKVNRRRGKNSGGGGTNTSLYSVRNIQWKTTSTPQLHAPLCSA